MPSPRANLKLDEQSFEALLAAAYTVQEHNAKQKRAGEIPCPQCGSMLEPEYQFCGRCGTPREEFRPGERMQRKWASLWTMSQKQQRQLEFGHDGGPGETPPDASEPSFEFSDSLWGNHTSSVETERISDEEGNDFDRSLTLVSRELDFADEASPEQVQPENSGTWGLPIVLRFRREDLYLGMAILVSALALMWVIWAAPVSRGQESARLTVWQRTLVKLGIAEAPHRSVVYHGDPTVKVWTDPHTALYYCNGDEQFGKTPGGHFSTQREAQMDRFSPAERTPCD